MIANYSLKFRITRLGQVRLRQTEDNFVYFIEVETFCGNQLTLLHYITIEVLMIQAWQCET